MKPHLLIFRIIAKFALSHPGLPGCKTQVTAPVCVVRVLATSVMLRGPYLCVICCCWCVVELQVSKV